MKKVFSAAITVLTLVNIVGLAPFYLYMLQEVKTEMSIELSTTANLEKIVVSAVEFSNTKIFQLTEEHEFILRGRLYDFKTMSKEGSNYIFLAKEDTKETTLTDLLKDNYESANTKSNTHKSPFGNLLKNFSKDFITTSAKQFVCSISSTSFAVSPLSIKMCSGFTAVISAPPDRV